MFNGLARKYFGLFTVAGAVLGLALPSVGVLIQPYIMATLFVLMFFATAKINKTRLVAAARKPLVVLLGLVLMFILIPLVMYGLALFAGLDETALFGVVFAAVGYWAMGLVGAVAALIPLGLTAWWHVGRRARLAAQQTG